MYVFFGFIIVLFVLLVTAAIGHLGWMLIARMFGYRVKTLRLRNALPNRFCARCGGRSILPTGTCGLCGWSREEQSAPSPDRLTIAAEQVNALMQAGLIDGRTHGHVMTAISVERKRSKIPGASPPPIPLETPAALPPIPVLPLPHDAGPPPEKQIPTPVVLIEKPPMVVLPDEGGELRLAPAITAPARRSTPPPLLRPVPSRPPRRPLSAVFASFMEENNIRWGELIGGLLIVGCSVALVVSFWAGITRLPWLQFSVFTAVTAAFFGLGLYTEHRWRLPLTSRGVLLIATLLVPLNFLAFAALSSGVTAGPLTLAAEIVAFALFTYFVWQAGKVIAPAWPELLTAGTCATSACLLILGCLGIEHADVSRLSILALLPLGMYILATVWMLARARRWQTIHSHGANAIFLLFGVLTFATTLAMGLLVYRSADPAATLRRLALPMSFGGLPALATGMLLWLRIKGAHLATVRTLGTTVAIIGALILVAGIIVAWPDPLGMLPIALCDFAALTLIALLYEIPAAHWLALPCAVIAWLIGFHLHRGGVSLATSGAQMTHALFSPLSGTALAPLTILIGAAWAGLKRWRIADARIYGRIGMLTAAASVALVSWSGFARSPDEYFATWIYGTYAIAAFALAWRTHRRAFAPVAWLLLTAALIQVFVAYHLTPTPWPSSLLTAATIAALTSSLVARSDRVRLHYLAEPGRWLAAIAPLMAVVIAPIHFTPGTAGRDSIDVYWAAGVVLFIAIVEETGPLFIIGQLVLAGGILLSVISRLAEEKWFASVRLPLLHPWTIQSCAIALAVYCLFWKLARPFIQRLVSHVGRALPAERLNGGQCPPYMEESVRDGGRAQIGGAAPQPPASQSPPYDRIITPRGSLLDRVANLLSKAAVFDHELSGGLLLTALGLAMFSFIPAIGMEFSSAANLHFSNTQVQASGEGSWFLVAILVFLFLAATGETAGPVALIALLTAIWIACPLLAVKMAHRGAAASSLRWLCAGYFLLCSIPLWLRHFVPQPLISNRFSQRNRSLLLPIVARATLIALGVVPILLLSVWPTLVWLCGDAVSVPASNTFFGLIGLSLSCAIPLIVIAMVLVGDAITERSQARAFAASIFFCLPGALVYLMHIAAAHHTIDGGDVLRLLQIIAIVMAFFAMGWLLLRESVRKLGHITGVFPGTLKLQVAIAMLLNGIILLPAGVCLAVAPDWAATFVGPAGGAWAMAALLSAVAAGIFSGTLRRDRLTVRDLTMASLALAAMVGLSTANLWPGLGWRAFHAMLSADGLAAWGLLGFGWWIVRRGRAGSMLAGRRGLAPSPLYSGERAGVRGEAPNGATPQSHDSTLGDASPLTPTLSPEYGGEGAGAKPNPSPSPPSPMLNYQQPDSLAAPLPVYFGGQDARAATIGAATAVSMLVMALAVRALAGDPGAPWWSMGAAGVISLLFITIACWARRPGKLYPAALLLNFAAATFYLWRGWGAGWSMIDFISVQAIAAAIPGIAWLVLELHVFRRGSMIGRRYAPGVHHLAAMGSTALALWATTSIVSAHLAGITAGNLLVAALALACAAPLMVSCLWDYKARYVLAGLYALGLGAIALCLTIAGVSPHWLPWALATNFACYALLSSFLFARADDAAELAQRIGFPIQNMYAGFWLPPANMALAAISLVAAWIADFSLEPRSARLTIATAAVAQTFTLELLADRGRWRVVRRAALWTLAGGAILWGWAWLPIDMHLSLDRCAMTFIIAVLLTYGLGLWFPRGLKPEDPWLAAARETAALLLVPSVLALIATLIVETLDRMEHPAARSHGVAIALLVTILGTCLLALESALRPGDPPRFSDRQRKGFVYAAEVLLAIAFYHLRISEPQLFGGLLRPYWPLVIMAIAFIGVGAAEVFRRQRRPILSEPLERTGIFLPLLPVIGWWLAPASGISVGFGQVLLVVAAFYAIVGALRRSLPFAGLAALAANGAFWDALAHSDNFGFFQHPQLWLIPASLCLLAGAQLNRDRLQPERLRTIRYACLVLIYVSSTADVFLNGVNHSPWLPLILIALSVGGVFLGVLFRVRAFLFLGTSFLFLSILTMIWFASSQFHWTWIWYVAGILLGTGILAIFALFEKKKEQMLALLDGLKRWE